MWRERLFWLRFRAEDWPWSRIILLAILVVALYSCWAWSRRAVALSVVNESTAAATLELAGDRREIAPCSSSVHFLDLDRPWSLSAGSQSISSADVAPPTPGNSYVVFIQAARDGSLSHKIGVPIDSSIWDEVAPTPIC